MKLARVILKAGKDKAARNFHPWIFSGAIDSVDDFHVPGDLVKVYASDNSYLGTGYLNPKSQIAVRMLSFSDEEINSNFFESRIARAESIRKEFVSSDTHCYRLIHAEGDFLPGLTVDRYHQYLVVQFHTLGMDKLKETILSILQRLNGVKGIYERCDPQSFEWEGMKKESGVLWGAPPPELLQVKENGLSFFVDLMRGQKTGFFLDQRDNRKLIGRFSKGRRVLNCFSYSGGFSVYALRNGAEHVTSVDSSQEANELCVKNIELNQINPVCSEVVKADVFDYLRQDQEQYDLIILDPPAFCKGSQQIDQAARGYKDINLNAMRKVRSGGLLFTASCSSYISADLFQKVIFGAAKDAKREVQIICKTSHAYDHPINIYHPEGEYLKGFFCRIA